MDVRGLFSQHQTSVILHICTAELMSVNTFMFVYMENSTARLQVEELWHHFEGRTDFDVDSELFHLNEIILKCSQSKKKYPAHDDSDQPLSISQHLLILPLHNQKT